MQLYDLHEDKNQSKNGKRNTRKNTQHAERPAGGRSTSGKRKNTNRELQMIGATKPVQKHRKIRADVVTKLDIIGEDVFEENRQVLLERQQRARQRRREERNDYANDYEDEWDEEDNWDDEEYDTRNSRRHSRKRHSEKRYSKTRKGKSVFDKLLIIIGIIIMLVICTILITKIWNLQQTQETVLKIENVFLPQKKVSKPDIVEDYLEINEYSRPGEALGKVNNIFVHYTANPGTTAKQNRNYFEGLAESGETSASAHFVIGYDGEILQCIPLMEIGYAVAEHNYDSISIECCYEDEDGHFTDATYQSLLHLTSWLMGEYRLSTDDVLRHFDASGKLCPKYYVENENAWVTFKADLENYIAANGK